MIEVIYSGETRKPKTQTEGTLAALKNIRQIGNAGGNTRIYVEDCVMSFLNRQMQKSDPVVAALLGKESQMENVTYLFVSGAILSDGITVKGEMLNFAPEAFPKLYEDMESYFPDTNLLGWYLPAYDMIAKYAATLGQNSRLFLLEDPLESEELFYLWEGSRLMKQSGYYIYYQRNEEMKNYMQNCREKLEEETPKKKIKMIENRKEEPKEDYVDDYQEVEPEINIFSSAPPKLTTFLYAASTVLAIVVLVIGITLINNYEKMYEMQETIETIASSIMNENDETGEITENPVEESSPVPSQGPEISPEAPKESNADGEGTRYYTIQQGDTLASISRKIYQTTDKITEIKQLNQGLDENELIIGEKIILP